MVDRGKEQTQPNQKSFEVVYKKLQKQNLTMMEKLARLFQQPHRQFKYLYPRELPDGLMHQYTNQVFWTPRYQKIPYTQDFLKYIKYLQRSNRVDYKKMRQFVSHLMTDYQTVMLQDRPELNITVDKDIYIPKNGICPYHGEVDWVYSVQGHNMTPVLFFDYGFNPVSGVAMALSNLYIRKQLKAQFQKEYPDQFKNKYNHANSYGHNNVYGYSIMTTGHTWQVIRIDNNYLLEKTVILEANNKYRSMIHDEELVSVLLGMLDYCLEMPALNRKVLQKSYQYIDEQRWMIQGTDDDEIKKAPWVSKLLLKFYKNRL